MNKNKQKASIDKYFKKGDLTAIVGSKYSNIPRLEGLWVILEDMWESIKAANQDVGYFKASIMTLFSMVAEYYTLQIDKDTRLKQKIEFGNARIKELKLKYELLNQKIDILSDTKPVEIVSSMVSDDMDKELAKAIKSLIKFNKSDRAAIISCQLSQADIRSQIKSIEHSMEFTNYDVTVNGKIMYDMTAQLMGKAEMIIKMLKEFNVSPNKLKPVKELLNGKPETITSQFKGLVK